MTPREANADLLTEITALRDRLASLAREVAELQGALTQAGQREAATSEVLRVISSSPTDLQPVFDTILRNAVRLCYAVNASLYQFDGQLIHLVAHHNLPSSLLGPWQRRFPRTLSEGGQLGEVLMTGAVMRIADVFSSAATWSEAALDALRSMDAHSALFVPMSREGETIGVIALFHHEVGAFTDQHVALFQTFSDQAVIAIENALCLPLIGPIGSRRLPQVFVMKPTDAWHCHHPALARWLHTPRLRRVLSQR